MTIYRCQYPGCNEPTKSACDNCDTNFCEEHGTEGGDSEMGNSLVAFPAVCWKCGGYNVDA